MERRLKPPLLDPPQNVLAPGDEQPDHRPCLRTDPLEQRFALLEQPPSALDTRTNEPARFGQKRVVHGPSLSRALAEPSLKIVDADQLPGDVNPIAVEDIALHILPMVCELQGGADSVAEGEEPSLARLTADHQHESAHGVGAATAILDQLRPGVVAGHGLILLEGADQPLERLDGEVVMLDRRSQSHKHGMPRLAREALTQFIAPPCEELPRPLRVGDLVRQIVRPSAKGVHRREVIAQSRRHEPAEHAEVLVM